MDTLARHAGRRVVVVVTSGLQNLHGEGVGETGGNCDVLSSHDGPDDQSKEDDEDDKVQDSIANDTALAKLRLLERVNGRADLATEKG